MRKILAPILAISSSAFGGSIGGSGGTPPAIGVEEHQMKELHEGVLRDELIHIRKPGHPEHFLLPNKDSLRQGHLSANDLESDDEGTFEVEQPILQIQSEIVLTIVRTIPVLAPGTLILDWQPPGFEGQNH